MRWIYNLWATISWELFKIPHRLFAKESNPPFFLVALPKKNHHKEEGVRCFSDEPHSQQLYIWPYQLQQYFLCMALIFLFSFWGDWIIIALSMLFLCFLLPYIIYFFGREPVLAKQLENWPSFLDYWLVTIPDEIGWWPEWPKLLEMGGESRELRKSRELGKWLLLILKRKRSFFIGITNRRYGAAKWSPSGSPQESMLRASLIDFFIDRDSEVNGVSVWHSQAFIRWVIYWATPVWGAYIVIIAIAIAVTYFDIASVEEAREKIAIAAFLCWLYSLYFIWKETGAFTIWTRLRERGFNHRKFLPPHLVGITDHQSYIPLRIHQEKVMILFGMVTAAYTGVAFTLLKILF